MLREESVAYSSLPQDEGTTPSSTFITSRSANSPHNQRDFKLATILTIGVIVAGLGLAATLPFILKGTPKVTVNVDKSSGDQDTHTDDFGASHLNAGQGANATIDDKEENSHVNSSVVATTAPSAAAAVTAATSEKPKTVDVIPDTQAHVKPKPVLITFDKESSAAEATQDFGGSSSFSGKEDGGVNPSSVTLGTPTGDADAKGGEELDDAETSAGGIAEDIGESDGVSETGEDKDTNEVGSSETVTKVTGEANNGSGVAGGSLNPSQGDSVPQNATHKPETDQNKVDMNQLLNAIYGEESEGGSVKPSTTDNNSWMSSMVSTQDKVTLVILAAVVAVALAVVIAGVGWLIHTRIAARRRRINIQNVITDLQSRDKVVLLNSESEEE